MTAAWILLIACTCILIAVVYLLVTSLHKRKNANVHIPVKKPDVMTHRGISVYEDREYTMKWPSLSIAFERIPYLACSGLRWQGASTLEKRILFVFYHQENMEAFMCACEQIFEENSRPYQNFDVFLCDDNTCVNDDIMVTMKAGSMSYCGIITDESSFLQVAGSEKSCAPVACGYDACMEYEFKGDNSEYDWFASLNPVSLFPCVQTEKRKQLLNILTREMKLETSGLSYSAKVKALLERYPIFTSYFYPEIRHEGDTLYLFDENIKMAEQSAQLLCDCASKANITMDQKAVHKDFTMMSADRSLYDRCVSSIRRFYQGPVIPVSLHVPYEKQIHAGCSVIGFAPSLHNRRVGMQQAVMYYRQLLLNEKQRRI